MSKYILIATTIDLENPAVVKSEVINDLDEFATLASNVIPKLSKRERHSLLVAAARRLHGSTDIEIDDPAIISEVDNGCWVQSWVWVPLAYETTFAEENWA